MVTFVSDDILRCKSQKLNLLFKIKRAKDKNLSLSLQASNPYYERFKILPATLCIEK